MPKDFDGQIKRSKVGEQKFVRNSENEMPVFQIFKREASALEKRSFSSLLSRRLHPKSLFTSLLQQKPSRAEPCFCTRNHFWPRSLHRVQVNSPGERRKQRRVGRSHLTEKILDIRARLNHQGSTQFAIECVFDDDVKNLYSVVDQNLKLLFGSLGRMATGENRPMRPLRASGQLITSGSGQNVLAAGPKNRHVLHNALPAHVKTACQFTPSNRGTVNSHPSNDLATPFSGGVRPFNGPYVRRCFNRFHVSVLSDILSDVKSVSGRGMDGRNWTLLQRCPLYIFAAMQGALRDSGSTWFGEGRHTMAQVMERRSERVLIDVPVVIRGETADHRAFEEETFTVTVSAHGALVMLATQVALGQKLLLLNPKNLDQREGRVAYKSADHAGLSKVALEFAQPAPEFWPISSPPLNWKSF